MSNQPRIEVDADGLMTVVGEMTFSTVADLWHQGRELIASRPRLVVDLAGVSRSDSAGLALLVDWLREARKADRVLEFRHVPEQMLAIARVSGVDQLLSLE